MAVMHLNQVEQMGQLNDYIPQDLPQGHIHPKEHPVQVHSQALLYAHVNATHHSKIFGSTTMELVRFAIGRT